MITLTLTDDQALEIMSQVSKALSTKSFSKRLNGVSSSHISSHAVKKGDMVKTVEETINTNYIKGHIFSNVDLQKKLGVGWQKISPALQSLRKKNKLHMVRRGTWQVTA